MRLAFYIGIILSCVLIIGCVTQDNLQYAVSPCNESAVTKGFGNAEITIEDTRVTLNQRLNYVCCANIVLRYEVESDEILKIYEDNIGEICKCMCAYDISATIKEPGIKKVQIYGVKYRDQNYNVLANYPGNAEECSIDDDCGKGGCSGTICQNRYAEPEITTCEWKEEYSCYRQATCGCVNGKCIWKDQDALDKCTAEKRNSLR